MIPRVAGSGESFAGAALYYLHDKRPDGELSVAANDAFKRVGGYALHDKGQRLTSDRVGFTEILNMEAETPADAIGQMSASYERFKEREAHKRGRKLETPVYCYSLSWSPDQQPTKDEMLAAARSSLKALRLEGLQTLIVSHIDEPQPHIHLIVNRIERDGSKARHIPFDRLRFSCWAEAYEREHGGIQCDQRVENNALRRQGIFVKDTKSLSRQEYEASQRAREGEKPASQEVPSPNRAGVAILKLTARHERELKELSAKAKGREASDRIAARRKTAALWQPLFEEQRRVRQELRLANRGGILERAVFVHRHAPLLRYAGPMTVRHIAGMCLSERRLNQRVEQAHRKDRRELADYQNFLIEGAAKIVWRDHRQDRQIMVQRHQMECAQLNYKLAVHYERAERAMPDQVHAAKEPAVTAFVQPMISAPQLQPGPSIAPNQINAVINGAEAKGAFNQAATEWRFPVEESTQEFLRRLEAYKRAHGDRDFGKEL